MVEAMLDLVKAETERIDSRFLESACGSGNFLVQFLRRKLADATRESIRFHDRDAFKES
jgi:type I restriction-modification system DNA methylase subunit